MGTTANAGSKFSIGTTVGAGTIVADFTADTFVAIGNIKDMGEIGPKAEVLVSKYVDQTYSRKMKGSRDNGSLTLLVERDSTDVGYIALIAAEKTSYAYNFCVELNDKPSTGSSPKNSKFYFKAIVSSASTKLGGPDDPVETTFELAISGPIFEVAASAS
ncbi:hypothetical protein A6U87_14680 [Rhizobium sp. AC44/96]|uniref:hypothetical protein n=1 Tax=Rhizobium sp. AC44/96 TaxID=1841654 RepID=UPI0008100CAF|nr:hypothetical protein [Rhizobium sp. AC44/96]OCJ05251.1 hypothetical protein A6U87_14680 [Rhizobium sp. AC44/96]